LFVAWNRKAQTTQMESTPSAYSLPRITFMNCVRDEIVSRRGGQGPLRLSREAVNILQKEAEQYLSEIMQATNETTMARKRKTIKVADMQEVMQKAVFSQNHAPDTILSLELEDEDE